MAISYEGIKTAAKGVVLAAGLAGILSGCDTPKKVVMKEVKIPDCAYVRLIRDVRSTHEDDFIMAVYDCKDNMIAKMKAKYDLPRDFFLIDENGKKFTAESPMIGYEP